jgi:hypothetical protein
MVDPFEEFEFKPLTEGLGFQKRKINEKTSTPPGQLGKEDLDKIKLMPPLPTTLNAKSKSASIPTKKPEAKAIEDLVRTFKKPVNLEVPLIEKAKRAHDQIQSWEFMPFVVDFLITSAIGLVGLIISLMTTKIDFMTTFQNPNTDIQFYLALPILFLGLGVVYMLIMRCFVGASIGEIVFDLQTGTTRDQESSLFPLKVLARVLLVTITGFILLPIVSIIFGRDLAGEWTGIPLIRKV